MNFSAVNLFERALADWWGAPYAVATDCCTHAIELCLRMTKPAFVKVPAHTYISVPFTLEKLNMGWMWKEDHMWSDYYYIENTNIIDAAVYWKEDGYIPGSLTCLSFQFKKPLNLGRGGAILCDSYDDYVTLKKMTYDGRFGEEPWATQQIDTLGYHYYMTPETAQEGLVKLPDAHLRHTKTWTWQDYPDLTTMPVFEDKSMLYYV